MKALLATLLVFCLLSPLAAMRYAEWQTNMGTFRCVLYDNLVPITANNFVTLANADYYDGCIFHRVINGFMIQDGDPTGTGSGGPGYTIPDEFHPDLTHDGPGVLAMANAGPNTGGSQYYITLAATPWLNGDYSIFGDIIEGMDVVFDIGAVPTDANDRPITPVVIDSIRVFDFEISSIDPEPGDLSLETGQEQGFYVMASGNDLEAAISWSVDGEPAGSSFFIFHTFAQPGEHQVVCNVSDGTYDLDFVWDATVTGTAVEEDTISPVASLHAWPNPFNPSTTIAFTLPEDADVTLEMFNVRGQRVATLAREHMSAGNHSLPWLAEGLASGVYFARLQAGSRTTVRKMVLMK